MKLLQFAILMVCFCPDLTFSVDSFPKPPSGRSTAVEGQWASQQIQSHVGSNNLFAGGQSTAVEGKWASQQIQSHVGSNNLFAGEDHLLSAYLLNMDREQGRNCVANATMTLLEELRNVVINGNGFLPPLDPLLIRHLGPYIYTLITVRASIHFHYLEARGLRTYLVDSVSFDSFQLTLGINITVPWLIISGTYDASAWLDNASQRAGGNFVASVSRLQLSIYARFGADVFDNGYLLLREFDITIYILDIQIQASSMVGSPSLNNIINFWLEQFTQNLLKGIDAINQSLSQDIYDLINNILYNLTITDVLDRLINLKLDDLFVQMI